MKEGIIQRSIIEYLSLLENQGKLLFWRSNNIPVFDPTRKCFRSMPKGSKKGVADICVIVNGYFIGLEVKNDDRYKIGARKGNYKDLQSEDQKKFEEKLKKNGGLYFVVHSFEEVKEILNKYV